MLSPLGPGQSGLSLVPASVARSSLRVLLTDPSLARITIREYRVIKRRGWLAGLLGQETHRVRLSTGLRVKITIAPPYPVSVIVSPGLIPRDWRSAAINAQLPFGRTKWRRICRALRSFAKTEPGTGDVVTVGDLRFDRRERKVRLGRGEVLELSFAEFLIAALLPRHCLR